MTTIGIIGVIIASFLVLLWFVLDIFQLYRKERRAMLVMATILAVASITLFAR